MAITFNHNDKVYVNGSNVGIGTSTPEWKLQIHENSGGANYIKITNDNTSEDGGNGVLIGISASEQATFWNYENTNMRFATNGTERVTITNDGNVGIGTTSPQAMLDVDANSSATNLILRSRTGSDYANLIYTDDLGTTQLIAIGNISGDLRFNVGSGIPERMRITAGGNVGIGTTNPTTKLYVDGGESTFNRGNSAGTIASFRGQNAEKVVIGTATSWFAGNVGIGSTAPAAKLNVASTGANAYSSTITKGTNMKGIINVLSNNADDMVGVYFGTGTTSEGTHWSGITGSRSQSGTDWSTQLNFYTHNEDLANITTATQKMVIKGNGNLGIGTTSPGAKLEVRGAGDGDLFIGRHSSNSSKLIYGYQSSADGFLEVRTGADIIVTKLSGYSGTPSYFLSNVGIGLNAPTTTLTVKGTSSNGIAVQGVGTTANRVFAGLNASNHGYLFVTGSSGQNPSLINSAGGNSYISGGNVGIGTTSPTARLSVTGVTSTTEPTMKIQSGTSTSTV
jgi:hypothetical protein